MSDLIERQAAIEAIRMLQSYKLYEGDEMLLVDKAEVQTELMMLPSAQTDQVSRDCNGCKYQGWYDTDFPCANCIRKVKDYYESM